MKTFSLNGCRQGECFDENGTPKKSFRAMFTTVMSERKNPDLEWLSKILLPVFVAFMLLSYFFVASAEHRAIVEINTLHNILVIVSALSVLSYSFIALKKQ